MKRSLFIVFISLFLNHYGLAQFIGGSADGYNKARYTNPTNIFAGGEMDGFSRASYKNTISIFSGAAKDGYDAASFTNTISIFAGGNYDGYSTGVKILTFVWTGNIGTGWNIKENWQDLIVPNLNSTVIIPNTALNFPKINAGLLSVGQNPNGGTYLCKRLFLLEGAEMTVKANTFLENYGEIEISGTMYVLNSAVDAVSNLSGGLIDIKRPGSLIFQ